MTVLISILKGLFVIVFTVCVLGGLFFMVDNLGKYIPYKYFEFVAGTFVIVVLSWVIGSLL